ncbi:MAG: response regulator transcription factor [Rhodospirillales bacterium]|nr:response regulator transcription factor [Rhodospirillales bacterium]
MRILLVEDNESLSKTISQSMVQMDHAIDVIDDGALAEDVLATQDFDLVILDLTLPGMDGLDVLKSLRSQQKATPVLILTARAGLEDRVAGLDLGADDYLTKPFELQELEARVRALLRRREETKSPVHVKGPLSFNTVSRRVSIDGQEVDLTPRERAVLEILIRHYDHVVSKDQISEHLFSFDDGANLSAIELYIHRLRKKIADPRVSIRTIRGLGYLLECP